MQPVAAPPRAGRKLLRVVVTLMLVSLAWWGFAFSRLLTRASVERIVRARGARLSYDYQYADEAKPLWRQTMYRVPGGKAFASAYLLDAQNTRFDDDDLGVTARLPELRKLWLWDSAVTDAGLARLPPLPALVSLSLPAGTTADGFVCLDRCPSLESLHAAETQLTDACVQRIVDLERLQEVALQRAEISDAQMDLLRERRPQLKIVR